MRSISRLLALASLLLALVACATTPPPAQNAPAVEKTVTPPPPPPPPPPPMTVEEMRDTVVDLETTAGTITIELFPDQAPNHARNFIDLSRSGFYDGVNFHRVIPGFMIQGGDPNTRSGSRDTWGQGGSETRLRPEFNSIPHERGIVSMARSFDPNSATSQFFICVAPARFLDGKYTVFGKVRSGMDVVDGIVAGKANSHDQPDEPVVIKHAVVRKAPV